MIRSKTYFKRFYEFLKQLKNNSICKPSAYKARHKQKCTLLYEPNLGVKGEHLFT